MEVTDNTGRVKSHEEVKAYIESLKEGSKESIEESKKMLIAAGVLDANGQSKDRIVSWE